MPPDPLAAPSSRPPLRSNRGCHSAGVKKRPQARRCQELPQPIESDDLADKDQTSVPTGNPHGRPQAQTNQRHRPSGKGDTAPAASNRNKYNGSGDQGQYPGRPAKARAMPSQPIGNEARWKQAQAPLWPELDHMDGLLKSERRANIWGNRVAVGGNCKRGRTGHRVEQPMPGHGPVDRQVTQEDDCGSQTLYRKRHRIKERRSQPRNADPTVSPANSAHRVSRSSGSAKVLWKPIGGIKSFCCDHTSNAANATTASKPPSLGDLARKSGRSSKPTSPRRREGGPQPALSPAGHR